MRGDAKRRSHQKDGLTLRKTVLRKSNLVPKARAKVKVGEQPTNQEATRRLQPQLRLKKLEEE